MGSRENDINIHVNTPGAPEAAQKFDKVSDAIKGIGTSADPNKITQTSTAVNGLGSSLQGVAPKIEKTSSVFSTFLGLFGTLGILATFATAAKKVGEFFDDLHRRINEAVQDAKKMRQAYDGLFEALGAYSEFERKKAVRDALTVMSETSTPQETGIPAIERYTRQFKGVMPDADYNTGLRNVLSYTARHGGGATPDLIDLMRGYNMTTSAQQYDYLRRISSGAEVSGMTDEEFIASLGKAAPSARALGMSSSQTIDIVASLSAGEIGRSKSTMPAMVIDAMAAPQAKALKEYGITGSTSQEIFEDVKAKSQGMSAESRYQMLSDIYGAGSVKGISKLMTKGAPAIIPISEAEDRAEAQNFKDTMEGQQNRTDNQLDLLNLDITTVEEAEEQISIIGEKARGRARRKRPYSQWVREFLITGDEAEKADAAKELWLESLSRKDRLKYAAALKKKLQQEGEYVYSDPQLYESGAPMAWEKMTPQERLSSLHDVGIAIRGGGNGGLIINNHNNMYINQQPPDAQEFSSGGLR
jgi:hypothetical protein